MIASTFVALVLASGPVHSEDDSGPSAKVPPNTALSDSQVIQVLNNIDEAEIDEAKKARNEAQNKDVKAFAKRMIDEHKANETDIKSISKKNSLSMEDSESSKAIKEDADASYKKIKKARKSNFDKIYIQEQISLHQRALDVIDTNLIPNAKNADLATLLKKTREVVSNHLEKAKELQSIVQ